MSTRLAKMLWGSSAPPAPPRLEPSAGLPARAGIQLKPEQCRPVLDTRPDIGFLEVRAADLMAHGGHFHRDLDRVRVRYPLALRGGVLICAQEPLDQGRLDGLAALIERYKPASVSERIAGQAGHSANDEPPAPSIGQALDRVCQQVDLVQSRLQRRILLEIPATGAESTGFTSGELVFLRQVVARTACGLALDLTSARLTLDGGRHFVAFIDDLPLDAIGKIRLHAAADEALWALYARVIARTGAAPTVLDHGKAIALLPALLRQAGRADDIMAKRTTPRTCGIYWGCG